MWRKRGIMNDSDYKLDTVLKIMNIGVPEKEACTLAGLSYDTYEREKNRYCQIIDKLDTDKNYILSNEDAKIYRFFNQSKKASNTFLKKNMEIILNAALGEDVVEKKYVRKCVDGVFKLVLDTKLVRIKPKWEAAAWLLSHRFPDLFGRTRINPENKALNIAKELHQITLKDD